MRIFLIRHGESIQNTGENEEFGIPDYKIYLTEKGKEQAKQSAEYLVDYLKKNNINVENSRMWVSPYERTRQTAKIFNEYLDIKDIKENLCLVEQQYGIFDSVPYEKWEDMCPNEYEYYKRNCDYEGKFWARLPSGESTFDVAIRVHQFFETIYRDFEKHGIDKLFIITHGTTLRAFALQWFHYPPEWFDKEPNPKNCWIRYIEDREDHGYVYNGQTLEDK